MKLVILVVDDEADVEELFRQQFRRDLRAGRFSMQFAQSGLAALQLISDASEARIILILSDINMPGMRAGSNCCPKARRRVPMCRSS
jgi:CheY-like chemotaxis protein